MQDEAFPFACLIAVCQNLVGTLQIVVLSGGPLRCSYSAQFEELISSTIEETKDIPEIISETGKIGMPHKGECLDTLSGEAASQLFMR